MSLPKNNLLIHGNNLLVLESLTETFRNEIQLVYLDPPYNTGATVRGNQESGGYQDRQDSTEWLEAMTSRFRLLRDLLRETGSIMVQLDENELDATKLALDDVFGREHFLNRIVIEVRAPSSFSTVNPGLFKTTEYILWYAKDRKKVKNHPLRTPRSPDPAYRLWLTNPQDPPEKWRIEPLAKAHPGADLDRLRVAHADQVCRLAPISNTKAGKAIVAAKKRSKDDPESVFVVERQNHSPQYVYRGNQLVFYSKQVQEIDGVRCASRPLTNLWTDLSCEGIAREGGVTYKTGKKPEQLLRRCLQLASDPGDWVLDCFLGSGTTAAAAHKMDRRWIGVEAGEAIALARARLERVCAGEDPTGITKICSWDGGGGFDFCEGDDGYPLVE